MLNILEGNEAAQSFEPVPQQITLQDPRVDAMLAAQETMMQNMMKMAEKAAEAAQKAVQAAEAAGKQKSEGFRSVQNSEHGEATAAANLKQATMPSGSQRGLSPAGPEALTSEALKQHTIRQRNSSRSPTPTHAARAHQEHETLNAKQTGLSHALLGNWKTSQDFSAGVAAWLLVTPWSSRRARRQQTS